VSDEPKKVTGQPLRGYELAHDHPPKPVELHYLQRLRDAVDPQGPHPLHEHECENCEGCIYAGHVVRAAAVSALLEHIDYLQAELDAVEAATDSIDWMGEGDG
jgi:hypothetical protein